MVRRWQLLLAAGTLAACKPSFDLSSAVVGARVLAVQGEPAEVRPGNDVVFRALVVSPDGTDPGDGLHWATCLQPKPLDENNIVSIDCLGGEADKVMPNGDGPMLTIPIPLNACGLFGPDPPPTKAGEPPLRPRDPDVSGGFYQPIRVQRDALIGFGLERITCNLAQAGADVAVDFARRYVANTNPTLLPVSASVGGQPVALDALPASTDVTLSVGWPAESVETYPVYDIVEQQLVDHRESLRVSWFSSAGAFLHERTGRGEDETETTTDNVLTTPSTPGAVHLWVVLRDSRGGTAWESYELQVQ